MVDALDWGRHFRVLAVVDDFTREALALVVDTSPFGARVARELDAVIAARGRRAMIDSDNGTELTSQAILDRANRTRVEWHSIAPRKPQQNAIAESFLARFRDECATRRCSARCPRPAPLSADGEPAITRHGRTRPTEG